MSISILNTIPTIVTLPGQGGGGFLSNKSLNFDGINDRVECGNGSDLQITGDISISCWFKTTDSSSILIAKRLDGISTGSGYQLHISSGEIYFLVGLNSPNTSTSARFILYNVDDGLWHHALGTLEQGVAISISVDGNTPVVTPLPSGTYNDSNTRLQLGYQKIGSLHYYYDGLMDEVSVFDALITSSDVRSISGKPIDLTGSSNLVAWYRMGENSTFSSQILMPENTNKNKFSNYSMKFDGGTDYVDCGNDSSLQPTGAITLSAWAKLDVSSFNDRQSLITQDHPAFAGLYNGYQLRWGTHVTLLNPYLNFTLCDENTSTAYAITGIFPPSVPLNTWHHICGIWDGTTMELFFDGDSMGTLAFSGTITYNTAINTLIGAERIGYYHSGNIDEVSIFNSPKAIGDLWDGTGKPTDLTGESGLVSWWRMGKESTFVYDLPYPLLDGVWTIPDQIGSNDGTSANMDIFNRVGEAPNSENNALSYNMDAADIDPDTP